MTKVTTSSEPDWYATGAWRSESLWQTFFDAMTGPGAASTIMDGDTCISLKELLDRACRIAAGLAASGIRPGDAVIVKSRNSIDAYGVLLACFAQGFVAIPLPPMFSPGQVLSVVASAEAKALILLDDQPGPVATEVLAASEGLAAVFVADAVVGLNDPRLRPWAACLSHEPCPTEPPSPDADALVLYSSGSTGNPKGVVHTGNSVRFACETLARLHKITAADRVLVALEFGFVGGTVLGALLAFISGASTVLMRKWDATQALETIADQRITYTLLMPTHCFDLINHPDIDRFDTRSLSRAILAGATPEQRRKAEKGFCGFAFPMYGMSESMAHCTCDEDGPEEGRQTTDGRSMPGTEIRLLDDDGRPVPAGEPGNIFLRGPNRMRRYQGNAELTQRVIGDGGWFSTGDRGRLDTGGFLTFMARASELIRRGGIMIQPAEVEAALRSHPAIVENAVIGVPDARLGEKACACILLRPGASLDKEAMRRHLESVGLPRYQWPEHLLVFDQFPRTPSLKVRRADLAALVRERLDVGAAT